MELDSKHFTLGQSLTTTLKNICRDYQAGGTVIRELLQNADDAGATTMRVFLDEVAYCTDGLQNGQLEELSQYQGPALLVFNDSIFTEADFKNLSHIGNSRKMEDGAVTGRFGRGFNSVYHWTDSPSIVSGDKLLVLDPHLRWCEKGGRFFDFVKNSKDPAMRNLIAAYQSMLPNSAQNFNGTIIRIPLRTSAQEITSEIVNTKTTVAQILEVLDNFARDFEDKGLIFLKNVDKLSFESTSGMSIVIRFSNREEVRFHKSIINEAVTAALKNDELTDFKCSFNAVLECKSPKKSRKTTFVVQHVISPAPESMRKWTKEQKLVGWVAVAAELPCSKLVEGSYFSVLPLPLSTKQPVHIHGHFTLSPDRTRIYQQGDINIQDKIPAEWNAWMCHIPLSHAWAYMIQNFVLQYPHEAIGARWPIDHGDERCMSLGALDNVLRVFDLESMAVFPAGQGFVTAKKGHLGTGSETSDLIRALEEVQVKVVRVPPSLYSAIKPFFIGRLLNPRSICAFLAKSNPGDTLWSKATKQLLLEYLIPDPAFAKYDIVGRIALVPFEDGKYRTIQKHNVSANGKNSGAEVQNCVVYVHRDGTEENLFSREGDRNIDLNAVTPNTQEILKQRINRWESHESIKHRSLFDFRDYSIKHVFCGLSVDKDFAVLTSEQSSFVIKSWPWLLDHQSDGNILNAVADLWLLPCTDGTHRKLRPQSASSELYLVPVDRFGRYVETVCTAAAKHSELRLQTVQVTCLIGSVSDLLLKLSEMKPELLIKSVGNLLDFTEWCSRNISLINNQPPEQKQLLVKILSNALSQKKKSLANNRLLRDYVESLQVFRRACWNTDDNQMRVTNPLVNSPISSIGLLDELCPLPDINGVQFIETPHGSPEKTLLETLRPSTSKNTVDIIRDHLIPAWKTDECKLWPNTIKEQSAYLILHHYSSLSAGSKRALQDLCFVPVSRINSVCITRFAVASTLVSPTAHRLKALFFNEEDYFPSEICSSKYNSALIDCGLRTEISEALLLDRVRTFAAPLPKYSLQDVQQRVSRLLKFQIPTTWFKSSVALSELRKTAWIPMMDKSGCLSFKSPMECRGVSDHLLVSSVLPVYNTQLSAEFEQHLGWKNILPNSTLFAQLKHGLKEKDRPIVDAVLSYIGRLENTEAIVEELKSLACVLTSLEEFILPTKAFLRSTEYASCEGLAPYFGNVDLKFGKDHEILISKLNVRPGPTIQNLLSLQDILAAKGRLEGSDVEIAVATLDLASRLPRSAISSDLKVLGSDGFLHNINDIGYLDGNVTDAKQITTHSAISKQLSQKLHIRTATQLVLSTNLGLDIDDDDEEFDQQEQVTTRIADTLERYQITSTFREYLANAEDAGATEISWILDTRIHPQECLISPALAPHQGPSLLVYNDECFTAKDFDGFKNVGDGSKKQDKSTIGQFGRGSQSMYHWTDVPMLLSGSWLLILDPQREVLPMNKHGVPMPGVKVHLSKLKNHCADQLNPFDGLFGYVKTMDYYPWTIFRFPLRTKASKLKHGEILDLGQAKRLMTAYFNEARISLLFLRKICSIEFAILGQNTAWKVTKGDQRDGYLGCNYSYQTKLGTTSEGQDRWWVAVEEIPADKETEASTQSQRRVPKRIECGIAVLMPNNTEGLPSNPPQHLMAPCFFSTLPLPLPSHLPVYLTGTFSLSGDRQSLNIDEHAVGTELQGCLANRRLLEQEIPKLYLKALEALGTKVPEIFDYFPGERPPQRSCAELVDRGFWRELARTRQSLFPKAENREQLLRIDEAVFSLIESKDSVLLSPFLLKIGIELVRPIKRTDLRQRILELDVAKCVSGPLLTRIFKSRQAIDKLQAEFQNTPVILDIVLKLILQTPDFEALHGCGILPLADRTLGRLILNTPSALIPASQGKVEPMTDNERISTGFGKALKIESSSHQSDGISGTVESKIGNLGLSSASSNSFSDEDTKNPDKITPEYYFIASRGSIELFTFAGSHFLDSERSHLFNEILESGRSNLRRLELSDYPTLLRQWNTHEASDEDNTKWLTDFWKQWNHVNLLEEQPYQIKIVDFLVDFAFRDGVGHFIKPSQIDTLPAIVKPCVKSQAQLCSRVPGLFIVDSELIPWNLRDAESSLTDLPSFVRFLKAVKRLSKDRGVHFRHFLNEYFTIEDRKVMRIIVKQNLEKYGRLNNAECTSFSEVRPQIQALPIWDSADDGYTKGISADESRIAANSDLLVPWSTALRYFIEPTSALQNQTWLATLDVKTIPVAGLLTDYVFPLPPQLSDENWTSYKRLMFAINEFHAASKSIAQGVLHDRHFAVDGNRQRCKPSDLFDHQEAIFMSAFRTEMEARFVHKDIRHLSSLWSYTCLQRWNGSPAAFDAYKLCLKTLSARITSSHQPTDGVLQQDTQVVLGPLTMSHPNNQRMTLQQLSNISNIRVFVSLSDFTSQPEYRRATMVTNATARKVLCLSDALSHDYVGACWSQVPLPALQPTKEILDRVPGAGRPSIFTVSQHLKHLKEISMYLAPRHVGSFYADLRATYAYLQQHLGRATFDFKHEALWLNFEGELEDLAEGVELIGKSWNKLEDLVLSISWDIGQVKAVHSSLRPYVKLLEALGCKSLIHTTINRPKLVHGQSVSASLKKLRADGKLLDVKYTTEGRSIQAHRVVLAAVSEKCAAQFGGQWAIEDITYDEQVDGEDFLSYHTLSTMIDFAYDDIINWESMEVTDDDDTATRDTKLDLLLDLHKGADYWMMPVLCSLVQYKIMSVWREFIRVDNVVYVKERAEQVRASEVATACMDFLSENKLILDRAGIFPR